MRLVPAKLGHAGATCSGHQWSLLSRAGSCVNTSVAHCAGARFAQRIMWHTRFPTGVLVASVAAAASVAGVLFTRWR